MNKLKTFAAQKKIFRKIAFKIAKKKGLVGDVCLPLRKLCLTPSGMDDACYIFNPTFMVKGSKILILARLVDSSDERSNIVVSVDKDFNIENTHVPKLGQEGVVSWVADCRFFSYQKSMYVTFNTGHSERPNKIFVQKVNSTFEKISDPIVCQKIDGRREIEKNWSFFEISDQLFCIYSISPFVVMKADLRNGLCLLSEYVSYNWDSVIYEKKYGELRGGASPFYHNGLFYHVVQSHVNNIFGKIYTSTIIAFDAHNDFRPISFSTNPIFRVNEHEYYTTPKKMLNRTVETCVYPAGASVSDGLLLLSYGVNDFNACLTAYDLNEVLSLVNRAIKILN